ncbi:MAG: cyclic-di-AMP receptor [Fimbriimonadales bacterium]|nr:cyclic-di-AMP receptor [Fimbriimonadales bacterium]
MKLIIAVIHNRDKGRVVDALLESQFKFTQVASTGGFLREGNTTLLIGVEDSQLEELLRLLESNCRTREQYVNPMPPDAAPIGTFLPTPIAVEVGGAVVFVLNVERFERF